MIKLIIILFVIVQIQAFSIQITKVSRSYSTFFTFIDETRSKSFNIKHMIAMTTSTINTNYKENSGTKMPSNLEYLLDYFNNEYFIVASVMALILLVPLIILTIVVKKFGKICLKKLCCVKTKKIDSTKSDSALSGECGCIVRIRKNKNLQANSTSLDKKKSKIVKTNGRQSIKGSDVLSKANFVLKNYFINNNSTLPPKDKLNPNNHHKNSFHSSSSQSLLLIKKAIIDSDDDLNDYGEYVQKSLLDIRKELLELDQNRLNFRV